jgi:low affinity Fe/Cu permease
MTDLFPRIALWTARQCGKASTFAVMLAFVLIWAATGPLFGWSTGWSMAINDPTTVITFLLCFLIQNAQTRDANAIQKKLDELIRATADARDQLIGLEEKSEEEIANLRG